VGVLPPVFYSVESGGKRSIQLKKVVFLFLDEFERSIG
jgi:hypothetical protein